MEAEANERGTGRTQQMLVRAVKAAQKMNCRVVVLVAQAVQVDDVVGRLLTHPEARRSGDPGTVCFAGNAEVKVSVAGRDLPSAFDFHVRGNDFVVADHFAIEDAVNHYRKALNEAFGVSAQARMEIAAEARGPSYG